MNNYIINVNEDHRGYHEVHNMDKCSHLPYKWNQENLGEFAGPYTATKFAQEKHPTWKVDGCMHCCPETHRY